MSWKAIHSQPGELENEVLGVRWSLNHDGSVIIMFNDYIYEKIDIDLSSLECYSGIRSSYHGGKCENINAARQRTIKTFENREKRCQRIRELNKLRNELVENLNKEGL